MIARRKSPWLAYLLVVVAMSGCIINPFSPYGGDKVIDGRIWIYSYGDNSKYRTPQNPPSMPNADQFTFTVAGNALNQPEPPGERCWWISVYVDEARTPEAFRVIFDAWDAGANLTDGFISFRGITVETDGTSETIRVTELLDLDITSQGTQRAYETCDFVIP